MLSRVIFLLLAMFFATGGFAQTSPLASGVWCGNVTATSGSVVARLNASSQRVRLAVATDFNLLSPIYSPAVTTASAAGNTVTLTIQGLQADTDYYYALEVAGVLRFEPNARGRFHTFPLGRGSFRIAFSGDSDYRVADQRAFDAIAAEHPLLFVHLGDLHYNDTNSTNIDDYRANYDSVLNQASEAALFRSVPTAYMWDDHDFCGNDSNGESIGRDTARAAYKERVPHYPIAAVGGAMAQAFTIGRVRVIMTDQRSASVSSNLKESASKTRLGSAQKTWLKQELISARDAGFPLILWICTEPWIDKAVVGSDSWGGYATERTEIANFLRDNHITNVALVAADMHGLAYDDGTDSDYATGGGAPVEVLQCAALTQTGEPKGGPYTAGPLIGPLQYGILEVYDTGGPSVACRFLGMKVGEGAKMTHIFSASSAGAVNHALVNISTLSRIGVGNDTLVSGFVISGYSPRNVLIRAIGPTLSVFGVSDALAQPQLSLYQGDNLVATNTGWAGNDSTADQMTTSFDRAGAFRLLDAASRDAALSLSLAPGAYTVQVKSANGQSGAALLEVYDLP